jgi:hypothetical protein
MANILDREKQISVIHHLAEGNSIRATSRLTRVHRNTIMDLLATFGPSCHHMMDLSFGNLHLEHLEIDEIWTFVEKKQRKLRPEFQNPQGTKAKPVQKDLGLTPGEEPPAKLAGKARPKKQPWPKSLPERFQAVKTLLEQSAIPLSPADCSKNFTRAKAATRSELLETLADLGQARQTEDGRFVLL